MRGCHINGVLYITGNWHCPCLSSFAANFFWFNCNDMKPDGAVCPGCTAWCSEIGSLASLDAPEVHASSDAREPISLHQAVRVVHNADLDQNEIMTCAHHHSWRRLFVPNSQNDLCRWFAKECHCLLVSDVLQIVSVDLLGAKCTHSLVKEFHSYTRAYPGQKKLRQPRMPK